MQYSMTQSRFCTWPYAKMELLKPARQFSTIGSPTISKTACYKSPTDYNWVLNMNRSPFVPTLIPPKGKKKSKSKCAAAANDNGTSAGECLPGKHLHQQPHQRWIAGQISIKSWMTVSAPHVRPPLLPLFYSEAASLLSPGIKWFRAWKQKSAAVAADKDLHLPSIPKAAKGFTMLTFTPVSSSEDSPAGAFIISSISRPGMVSTFIFLLPASGRSSPMFVGEIWARTSCSALTTAGFGSFGSSAGLLGTGLSLQSMAWCLAPLPTDLQGTPSRTWDRKDKVTHPIKAYWKL